LFVHASVRLSLKNKNEPKSPHSQTFLQKVMHNRQPMTANYRHTAPALPPIQTRLSSLLIAPNENKIIFSNILLSST
jgi:hypothetical protein